jgi:putative ABC transport system permease protein
MNRLIQDVQYALRQLRKNPGFTLVVVLSLALGIGATSTIFSVLDALLYRPLPYDHPEQLVSIWQIEQTQPDSTQAPPIAEMVDWEKQNHVFQEIGLTSNTDTVTFSGSGEPQPIGAQYSTPSFFRVLGVKPALGRIFFPEEMRDTTQTLVISDSFWKHKFNGDRGILGKRFNVEGVVSTVVGVMPPGFDPFYGDRTDVWIPIDPANHRYSERQDHWLMPIARLRPGVTLAQAQTEMDVIARRLEQAYPATNKGVGKRLVPLHEQLYGWAGPTFYPLFGAVAFVLLIACVNVANLMQSRSEVRRKEYALRSAMGSNRRQLVQQMLVESGVLALLGGTLGIALTFIGIQLFVFLAGEFPNRASLSVNLQVLLFTLCISMMTALLFGLLPALQGSRPNLNLVLREGESRTTTASFGWTRRVLAVSEVALAMVLLAGAGLMVNTMLRLHHVDPGFDPDNVLTMAINLPEGGKYMERVPGGDREKAPPASTNFYQHLLERVSALPGVDSAGIASHLPISRGEDFSFSVVGHPAPPPDRRPQTGYSETSPGWFRALRIPIRKGRYLDDHDTQTSPWVVVINETLAHRYFPNEDPIGQLLQLRYEPYGVDEDHPRQIVGIVADVKQFGVGEPAPPFVYLSYLQQPSVYPGGAILDHLGQRVLVRTSGDVSGRQVGLTAAVKRIVAELDPEQPVTRVMTMDRVLSQSLGGWRFYTRILGVFAGIAVLLAMVGIYGVMAYFVGERTHEIGVRVALGATPSDVLAMVGKLGLKLTLTGIVIGVGLAMGLTRLIAEFLVGVKPTDPTTYSIVAGALLGVAMLACYIPARRAAKVDPMVALRYE